MKFRVKSTLKYSVQRMTPTKAVRIALLVISDALILNIASFLALWVRFEFHFEQLVRETEYLNNILRFAPYYTAFGLIVFALFKLYTSLWQFASIDEFLKIIDDAENAKLNKNENQNNGYELLGITGCPTGIAHTYMAAEGLENAGKEMGHLIKVETQGQSGAQNVLTDEEIKRAKAIIIAADVNVDLSRFDGKRILRTGVTDGIRRPKELIEKALNDDIPIYHSTGSEDDGNGENANSNKGGKNIYLCPSTTLLITE